MLQYMKRTDLKNPDITDRSERLIELDEVVQEVKSSEEWEEVEMSLLQTGLSRGEEIGKEIGEKIGKGNWREGWEGNWRKDREKSCCRPGFAEYVCPGNEDFRRGGYPVGG